jgi:methylated-DNA-[protein]-cysteine S-methyltransferase
METYYLNSPIGTLRIQGDENGVSSVSFLNPNEFESREIPDVLTEVISQLEEYFNGTRYQFEIKLNPQGTEFQKRVWKELIDIPYSKTISYQELANRLKDPMVIRAAAAANGKNPIAIIIPCHRVIGSDGSLTGYAGGLHRKKWLLDHENPVKQQSLFQ